RRPARKLPLDAVLVRRGALHDLQLWMRGQHLIVDTADPVTARADFAVGHCEQILSERSSEVPEHVLGGIERNAAHQQQFVAHAYSPSLAAQFRNNTVSSMRE